MMWSNLLLRRPSADGSIYPYSLVWQSRQASKHFQVTHNSKVEVTTIMKLKGMGNILFVKDFEKMAEFYENVLNLNSDVNEKGWRKYTVGGGTFALHAIPKGIADAIQISNPPRAREETPFKPVFQVDDLPNARNELLSAGVKPLYPNSKPNNQRLDLLDPEGNVFQITS